MAARWAGLSVSQTGSLLGFSRVTTVSRVHREWSQKEKKYPMSCSWMEENALLMNFYEALVGIQNAQHTTSTLRHNVLCLKVEALGT